MCLNFGGKAGSNTEKKNDWLVHHKLNSPSLQLIKRWAASSPLYGFFFPSFQSLLRSVEKQNQNHIDWQLKMTYVLNSLICTSYTQASALYSKSSCPCLLWPSENKLIRPCYNWTVADQRECETHGSHLYCWVGYSPLRAAFTFLSGRCFFRVPRPFL